MTDKLLPLSREELDEIDARKHILYDEMQNLIKQSRTALELQAEVERLKEVLIFADKMHAYLEKDHILPRCLAEAMCRYGQARTALADHRSGTCPEIKKEGE